MEGKRTINSIKLKNILSFGSEGQEIELQPLNVLIGPNASGKSNFIEVFRLLRALPDTPAQVIRDGGGAAEWLWKGGEPNPIAAIDVVFEGVSYCLKFAKVGYQWEITYEDIKLKPHAQPVTREGGYQPEESIWSRLKHKPDKSSLAQKLTSIGIYKEWNSGRFSPIRSAQRPDLPGKPLREDLSNFGLLLNNLPFRIKQQIADQLKQVYDGVEEVITQIDGGTVQAFIQEKGLASSTPLLRVSDGTLRYLFLLTLLNQPDPPPLICLEEPESGLHPDVIHKVAELLIEASRRTQLIVTTHSEFLVSALSEMPEALIICERDQNGTQLNRLDPESLKEWLERYSLGDLWMKGELGGTRW